MTRFRPTKPFYSPDEIAAVAGLSSSTVLKNIESGRLFAVMLSGGTYRIPARAVWMLVDPASVPAPAIVVHEDAVVDVREADRDSDH